MGGAEGSGPREWVGLKGSGQCEWVEWVGLKGVGHVSGWGGWG